MTSYSLQADISTLSLLQKKVIDNLTLKEAHLQQTHSAFKGKSKALADELVGLRQFYASFATECKNQWLGVYNELLAVFHRVVQVYQIKISNLQSQIAIKDSRIKELQTETSYVKYSENIYQELWRNQQNLYGEWDGSSAGKRIKISDVIAVNSHSCSMSTPLHNNSINEAITEALQQNETEPKPQQALLELTEHLNRNLASRRLEYEHQNPKESERYWQQEVSPIMSASSEKEIAENQVARDKKLSFQMNKENRIPYYQNIKMGKSQQTWKSTSSSIKLNQLRKTLIQRKKSDQLF